jgi:alpha-1,2-mannosyltransferase
MHIWSYPPHFLLFTWPLALMPYMPAYIVYCALGMVLYLWVVSDGERRPDHFMLLALAPAAVVNIWTGQNGFFVAALLLGGILQLDRRPVFSGVLFGLLSIKPQLGVLLPLVLALTGRWRTIAAAAATIGALFAATTLAFGGKVWTAYWFDAMPTQSNVVFGVFQHYMVHMPTAFMNARVAGIPTPFALCIQAVVSLVTLAAVIWTYWRPRDPVLSTSLLLIAVFTVTPYAFNYDMVVLGWVTVQLMDRDDNTVWDYALMLAVWAMPFLTALLGLASIPASCLPILGLGGRLVWRMWTAERACRPAEIGLAARAAS